MSTPSAVAALRASVVAILLAATGEALGDRLGIGAEVDEATIAGWDIDVSATGQGLPPGRGSVSEGKRVYEAACAVCHGKAGEGKPADRLVGGLGTLASATPVRTIGSFWPYAPTIYDYVYRAMPHNRPQTLTPSETYAVTAYLLYLNGLVGADAVLDAKTLPQVSMPNRYGFHSPDPRPDVVNVPCRRNCAEPGGAH